MNAARMQKLAALLQPVLPANMGYALLVFDFGSSGRMNYVSNAQCEDMIAALVELLAHLMVNIEPGPTIAALEATIKAIRDRQS